MPRLTSENLAVLQCSQSGFLECYFASWIWKVVPITLIVFGVIGNILSLITFSTRNLRKKSTCVYLILLAVSDTILLCSAPLNLIINAVFGVDMRSSSSFSCLITGWVVHTSGMTSCWAIVLVTVERTFVTLFPVKAKPKMTSRNAVIASVSLLVIVMLLNGHLIYGRVIMEMQLNITNTNETSIQTVKACLLRPGKYLEFYNVIWKRLLVITGSVVPLILIVTGNAIVAISLLKSTRALRRVQHSDGRIVGDRIQQSSRNNSNYKMFFILCIVFLVTTVPYGVYLNLLDSSKLVDEHTLAKYQLSSVIMRCLYWSNYSLNFLLYCMTGSLFRKEFKRILQTAHASFSSLTTRRTGQPQNDENL